MAIIFESSVYFTLYHENKVNRVVHLEFLRSDIDSDVKLSKLTDVTELSIKCVI